MEAVRSHDARTVFVGLARLYMLTVYDRIFGDFPVKITVYTPFIYGSGQPCIYTVYVWSRPTLRCCDAFVTGFKLSFSSFPSLSYVRDAHCVCTKR